MKKGFSLIEILVSSVILIVLLGGILAVLRVANLSYEVGGGLLDLQQGARQVMDGMIREVRQSSPASLTVDGNETRLDFYMPNISNPISYYLADNQIIREHPSGNTRVLANDVSNMTFCCLGGANCTDCSTSRLLQIQVQVNKTVRDKPVSFNLTEKVKLRN